MPKRKAKKPVKRAKKQEYPGGVDALIRALGKTLDKLSEKEDARWVHNVCLNMCITMLYTSGLSQAQLIKQVKGVVEGTKAMQKIDGAT